MTFPHAASDVATPSAQARVRAFFAGTGLRGDYIPRIVQSIMRFSRGPGNTIDEVVESVFANYAKHPWYMAGTLPGVGFGVADRVARRLGYTSLDPARLAAGLRWVLAEARDGHGDTGLPTGRVVAEAARLLRVDAKPVAAELGRQCVLDGLRRVGTLAALPSAYDDDAEVWHHIQRLRGGAEAAGDEPVPTTAQDGLTLEQTRALYVARQGAVACLTGPPGAGKTYCLRRWCDDLVAVDLIVLLMAPTGKAARRLSQATGRPAQTIHASLEGEPIRYADAASPDEIGAWTFRRDVERPLHADAVVVDESSMLDSALCAALLRACAGGTRVLFVGDADQLQPVQPGRPFADLCESGAVPVARLTEIHRHRGDIPHAAKMVLDGGAIERWPNKSDGHVFFLECDDPQQAQATIVDLVARRLPAKYPSLVPGFDIQVLSPRRGQSPLGCAALNQALRAALNPSTAATRPRGRIEIGDRVMVTRNLSSVVRNGGIGVVLDVLRGHRRDDVTVAVKLDDGAVSSVSMAHVEYAYALTVHKYQGSQVPVVVLAWHGCHGSWLPDRSVLYTAISRAERLCVVVGQRAAVRAAVRRGPQRKRTTVLRALCAEAMSTTAAPTGAEKA